MTRLLSSIRQDFRLQKRYGIYYAAAFVTLVWLLLLRQVPNTALDIAVPFIIFTDLGVVGFYFIAGMLLFEKGEGTLSALVVTPLRFWEYLCARLATLTFLALAISFAVVAVSYGAGFNVFMLGLGVVLTSLITLLVGFISVVPYRSISSYLLPSQFYLMALYFPLVDYFGYWQSPVFYLLPTQGSLLLLKSAFLPVETWQIVYSVLYQCLWVVFLSLLARRAFERHIVAGEGGS